MVLTLPASDRYSRVRELFPGLDIYSRVGLYPRDLPLFLLVSARFIR